MRLLPPSASVPPPPSETSTSERGRRKAKPIAGLEYLFEKETNQNKNSARGGEEGERGSAHRRTKKGGARRKLRKVDYELLTDPEEGLPVLFERVKTFRLDERLPLVRDPSPQVFCG